MQEGLTLFDLIFIIMLGIFIVTRFLGNNLPKDKSKPKRRSNNVFEMTPAQKEAVKVTAKKRATASPKSFENLSGLAQVKAADPDFNEKEFKNGAKSAFQFYYEALNTGDEEALENLLSPRLMDEIDSKIDALEEKKQLMKAEVGDISSIEIVDGRMSGKTAIIDVKYSAKVAEYTVDSAGKIKTGKKTPQETVIIWTWARATNSDDPNWELEEISKPS